MVTSMVCGLVAFFKWVGKALVFPRALLPQVKLLGASTIGHML